MKINDLSRRQIIILIQLILKKMGKKKTIAGLPKPKAIVVHHGAGDWDFEQVNREHRKRWGFKSSLGYYAGYHYFIAFDGKLTQARKDTEEAAHTAEAGRPHYWNRNSIGICLQGNTEIKEPTSEQLRTLRGLLDAKTYLYGIPTSEIYGHKNISPTLCPGKHLYKWLTDYKKVA